MTKRNSYKKKEKEKNPALGSCAFSFLAVGDSYVAVSKILT